MPSTRLIPFSIAQVEAEFKVEKKVDGTEVMVWQPKESPAASITNDFNISLVGHFLPFSPDETTTTTTNATQQLNDFVKQQQSSKDVFIRLTTKFGNATPNPSILVSLTDSCLGAGTCLCCKTMKTLRSITPATAASTCIRLVGFVKPIKTSSGGVLTNFIIARSVRIISTEAKTVQSISVSIVRKQMFKTNGSVSKTSVPLIKKAATWNDNFNLVGHDFTIADHAVKFCQANQSSDGVSKALLVEQTKLSEDEVGDILIKLCEVGLLYETEADHFQTTV